MRDGIYKAYFGAGDIKHLGLVAVKDGTITGTDITHFITGSFTRSGNRFKGQLTLTRHTSREDFQEIAYLDVIDATFEGVGGETFGEFDAEVVQKRGLRVWVKFQRICGV